MADKNLVRRRMSRIKRSDCMECCKPFSSYEGPERCYSCAKILRLEQQINDLERRIQDLEMGGCDGLD